MKINALGIIVFALFLSLNLGAQTNSTGLPSKKGKSNTGSTEQTNTNDQTDNTGQNGSTITPPNLMPSGSTTTNNNNHHHTNGGEKRKKAVPTKSTSQITDFSNLKTYSVKKVGYGNPNNPTQEEGTFTYLYTPGQISWTQKVAGTNTYYRFVETHRDQWSIYLYDETRRINVAIDFHTRKITFTGPKNPSPTLLYTTLWAAYN